MVLDELFEKLGHNEFVIGGGFGGYNWDWGLAPIAELDEFIEKKSRYLENGYFLEIITREPQTPYAKFRNMPEDKAGLFSEIPTGLAIESPSMRVGNDLIVFDRGRHEDTYYVSSLVLGRDDQVRYETSIPASHALDLILATWQGKLDHIPAEPSRIFHPESMVLSEHH